MIAKARTGCIALFLVVCILPLLGQSEGPNGLVDQKMRVIAGEKALNCGWKKPGDDPKASLKCARRAIKRKQPFIVRFDSNGIEGLISRGFAGNGAGDVYWIHVDSYTCRDIVQYPDRCPDIVKCPKPVRFFYYIDTQGEPFGHDCVPLKGEKR